MGILKNQFSSLGKLALHSYKQDIVWLPRTRLELMVDPNV
jgi:hypothetical protein